jgi:hypothetical protein
VTGRARGSQSGQTLVMFAAVLALLFTALLALVANVAILLDRYNQDGLVALLGAQAGASAVDEDAYYGSGSHLLREGTALSRCRDAARQAPRVHVDCRVTGDAVRVTVTESVALPITLGQPAVPISVTRQARGVFGGRNPGAP